MSQTIATARLDLVSLGLAAIYALQEGRLGDAQKMIGAEVPAEWVEDVESPMHFRRLQMEDDPSTQPWLLRAIVLRDQGKVVGHINFHAPPGTQGWVEIGYSILPAYRRRGIATEATLAMFEWAARHHGVRRFRASISPTNEPSLRMLEALGDFKRIGTQWDEIDGEEIVFEMDASNPRPH